MGRTRSQQGPLFALGGGPGAPDEGSVQPPSKGSPRLLAALRPCGTELGCDVNPRKPREDGRLNPPSAVSCHAAAGDPSQRPRRGLRRRSRHAVPQPPAGHPCSSGGRSFGHAGGHSRDGRVWLRPRELMLLSQGHVWPCLSLAAPLCGGAWRLRGARRASRRGQGPGWPGPGALSSRAQVGPLFFAAGSEDRGLTEGHGSVFSLSPGTPRPPSWKLNAQKTSQRSRQQPDEAIAFLKQWKSLNCP